MNTTLLLRSEYLDSSVFLPYATYFLNIFFPMLFLPHAISALCYFCTMQFLPNVYFLLYLPCTDHALCWIALLNLDRYLLLT